MSCMKCIPTTIFAGVDISKVFSFHLLQQKSSQWGSQKSLQGSKCLFISQPTFQILPSFFWLSKMAVFPKGCYPDNFESHNSLNFRFTKFWGLYSNFIDCESFLELNSSDILALFETYLKGLSLFNSLLLMYIVLQFVLFWWNW